MMTKSKMGPSSTYQCIILFKYQNIKQAVFSLHTTASL